MGAAWDHEDSHERRGHVPKLTMAGRLDGTFGGRTVVITADPDGIVLQVQGLRSAWQLRKFSRTAAAGLFFLKSNGIPLSLRIGNVLRFELLPKPHPAVALLLPGLIK